jgi:hypothetical protein
VEGKANLFHPIIARKGLYELQLGQAHDLKADDKFLIFKEATFTSECIGVTKKIHLFKTCSHLELPDTTIASKAFAVRAIPSSEESPICIAMKFNIQDPRPEWLKLLRVKLVDHGEMEQSKLVLGADGSCMNLTFTNSDPFAGTLFLQWPFRNNDELYWHVFAQISHFYHQLGRHPTPVRGPASIEINMIVVTLDDQGIYQEAPGPTATLSPEQDLDVVADGKTTYGFKITNKFNHPVYFSFFYFSQTRFSIGV